jgi:hypothetical protein
MPIAYDIVEDQQLVIAKGSGVIVAGEILSHMNTLAADKRYVAPMKKLVDYREVQHLNLSEHDARDIARRRKELAKIFHDERCAFVSPADAVFAATRVHESLVNVTDTNTAVFRTLENAENWLGIKLQR